MMNVHPLPPETYAIMVHKLFRDRVQEFLLTPPTSSSSSMALISATNSTQCDDTNRSSGIDGTNNKKNVDKQQKQQILLLDEESLTGVSQSRRGTVLVLLKKIQRPVQDLSPMARQSCSWILKTTHEASYDHNHGSSSSSSASSCNNIVNKNEGNDDSFIHHLGRNLWQTLEKEYDFDSSRGDILRVDVHPRNQVVAVCRALQQSAAAATTTTTTTTTVQQLDQQSPIQKNNQDNDNNDDDDPFESGPIEFTRSRSKCTHRLGLILLQHQTATAATTEASTLKEEKAASTRKTKQINTSSSSSKEHSSSSFNVFYWGVDRRPLDDKRMDLALNHEAADEIQVVPSVPACYNNKHNSDSPHASLTAKTKSTCLPPPAKAPKRNNEDSILHHQQPEDNYNNNKYTQEEIPVTVPVSRAYYKLHQVWTDYLSSSSSTWAATTTTADTAALDLGASPGGWTQVLVHDMGYRRVVAVDPATLAPRVQQLTDKMSKSDVVAVVTHIQANLHRPNCRKSFQDNTIITANKNDDDEGATEQKHDNGKNHHINDANHNTNTQDNDNNDTSRLVKLLLPHGPYSMVVCDASMLWPQMLDSLEEWVQAMISASNARGSPTSASGIFALPSTWVITMKLPFKTLGSIKRNVQQIKERIGLLVESIQHQQQQQKNHPKTESHEEKSTLPSLSWLDQMARHLGKDSANNNNNSKDEMKKKNSNKVVRWNAQVAHLMANSDSERTLIATFFEQQQEPI